MSYQYRSDIYLKEVVLNVSDKKTDEILYRNIRAKHS